METNSIGHENKYHLQVTFEDKTDPKNTGKKQRYTLQKPYCISISQLQRPYFCNNKTLWKSCTLMPSRSIPSPFKMHKQNFVHAANSFSRANIRK